MNEILPGIWHWTAFHEGIGMNVHSYFASDANALIDPMVPAEGIDWFSEHGPEKILLTNRHHYRHSGQFVDAFGCEVLCNKTGLHEFEGGPSVSGFDIGDQLAPGITAREMNSICPDDTVFHIAVAEGALAFADALVRFENGRIGFVGDEHMDDPDAVKDGIRAALGRLYDQEAFDSLLFAHGEPLVGGAKAEIRRFLDS